MSAIESVLDDLRRILLRYLPGLTVLAVVMILLRGLTGSVEAIKLQTATLSTSFLGAGDGMIAVLVHTLPLTIAAAIATFAIASRMITFESSLSIVGLAGIVMIGASLGGFLRGFAPETKPQSQIARTIVRPASEPAVIGFVPNVKLGVHPKKPPLQLAVPDAGVAVAPKLEFKPKTPLTQLGEIDWFAQPDLSNSPPQDIPPLNLLPNVGSVPGAISKAINQLLGYLVAYQPRLFLAAILAGSWVGWSWHRRLQRLAQYSADIPYDPVKPTEVRRAA